MLDFTPVFEREKSLAALADGLTPDDLRDLTNEMIDAMLALIADCSDADVVFVPDDPDAFDSEAATEEEEHMAWTLGHVIVHTTASSEEYAALAAEQARGILKRERSRWEVPWRTVTTIEQCRHRLEESRRMRLASLDMWPDAPHLDLTYQPRPNMDPVNAITRFVAGLGHDTAHLKQIEEIVRQAHAAESA